MQGKPPQACLDKAVYVMNFLSYRETTSLPPLFSHFSSLISKKSELQKPVRVQVRDLISGQWRGPVDLLTWGKGYACVSTENGPHWIPARCVKPYLDLEHTGGNRMEDSIATREERVGDTG